MNDLFIRPPRKETKFPAPMELGSIGSLKSEGIKVDQMNDASFIGPLNECFVQSILSTLRDCCQSNNAPIYQKVNREAWSIPTRAAQSN